MVDGWMRDDTIALVGTTSQKSIHSTLRVCDLLRRVRFVTCYRYPAQYSTTSELLAVLSLLL
jgi:hypothetical protein